MDSEKDARPLLPGLGIAVFSFGVVFASFNLRPAITSAAALFPEIGTAAGLNSAGLALLAAVPVVCFGVFSGFAPALGRRFGEGRTVSAALVLLALSLFLRAVLLRWLVFPATVAASAAIAVLNVTLPGYIHERHPERTGLLLGEYLVSLYAGAALASATSGPVYSRTSHSPSVALGIWAVPALLAFVAWSPQFSGRAGAERAAPVRVSAMLGEPTAWYVAGFMGFQSVIYYATQSWLAAMLRSRGLSLDEAGYLLAAVSVAGMLSAFFVPILAAALRSHYGLVAATSGAAGVSVCGVEFGSTRLALVYCAVLGLSQGAGLALATYFAVTRSTGFATPLALTAMSQTVGYALAAGGSLAFGFLFAATTNWRAPTFLLVVFAALECVCGCLAARPNGAVETQYTESFSE